MTQHNFKNIKRRTWFEFIVVVMLLAVVVLFSAFELWRIQIQSAWEADLSTLKNIVRIAEVYAQSENKVLSGVSVYELIIGDLIEDQALNRRAFYQSRGTRKSYSNGCERKLSEVCTEEKTPKILFNKKTGNVSNLEEFVVSIIGLPPNVKNVDEYLSR